MTNLSRWYEIHPIDNKPFKMIWDLFYQKTFQDNVRYILKLTDFKIISNIYLKKTFQDDLKYTSTQIHTNTDLELQTLIEMTTYKCSFPRFLQSGTVMTVRIVSGSWTYLDMMMVMVMIITMVKTIMMMIIIMMMILMIFDQQKTAQRPSSRANGFLNGSSYFKASSSFFS